MTSCTGTSAWRISFCSAGRGSSSMRRCSRLRTLFSCPAVVWIAYHRYSICLPREPRDSVHQDRLEHIIEEADGDPQQNREDHDHPGGLDQLVPGRPGHLAQLFPHGDQEVPRPVEPADQPVRGLRPHLHALHGYLDSLWTWCVSQWGQYFRRSTRSGCFRLFLSVKKLRFLHSVHSRMILSLGMARCRSWLFAYFRIWVTTPAPTVRPPSRMAKRSPSSMAIGVISSMVICTLSPGITISTPAASSTLPVTSVVRK